MLGEIEAGEHKQEDEIKHTGLSSMESLGRLPAMGGGVRRARCCCGTST